MGNEYMEVVTIVSADVEWQLIRTFFHGEAIEESPYGEYFQPVGAKFFSERQVLFFQGGWGKISAAASAQYAIDQWQPKLLVNLGTCGGFEGEIERNALVLVERTIVYDIFEEMGDAADHIAHYTTELDLSWLREPLPEPVIRGLMVSGDRDLSPGDIESLKLDYGAFAGDWETGAIAFVAKRNGIPCLILRGVSDLVGTAGGEAYSNPNIFKASARKIMTHLVSVLPEWIDCSEVFID